MDSLQDKVLQDKVSATAEELGVPGVSAGVLIGGEEHYAFHGVTSVENPLPVDETTLFQFGSTGKTYTATAMMRLVEQGKVDLDAPVRTYLPEFRLKDEDVARRVTVLQLFNHTAGWQGDMMDDTGNGDDALDIYVARMTNLEQATPLGSAVSYNNASLSVAGLIIAKVTGTVYEQAIKDLLFTPLGLDNTYFFTNDIISRRFAVGHTKHDDGTITIARPWAMPRGNAPAGGMSANAHDQLAWARFHLGGGVAPDGTQVLSAANVARMQQPTAEMRGSALGDYVGISWLLRDVEGTRIVGHGGTTNGQYSDFTMVPSRDFAFISMSNCGPNGAQLNHEVGRWALEHYLGLVEAKPEAVLLPDEALAPYVGRYETIAAAVEITASNGWLSAKVEIKPEMLAVLREAGDDTPEDQPPMPLAMTSAGGDQYVIPEGPGEGMTGYFSRDADGNIDGVHLGGRLATRAATVKA